MFSSLQKLTQILNFLIFHNNFAIRLCILFIFEWLWPLCRQVNHTCFFYPNFLAWDSSHKWEWILVFCASTPWIVHSLVTQLAEHLVFVVFSNSGTVPERTLLTVPCRTHVTQSTSPQFIQGVSWREIYVCCAETCPRVLAVSAALQSAWTNLLVGRGERPQCSACLINQLHHFIKLGCVKY